MGLNFSVLFRLHNGSPAPLPEPGLGDLPENCVAAVLGYLGPPEICKLARLNRAFRGASWADFVWESKLPPNYEAIARRVFGGFDLPPDLSKREIYTRLCRQNPLDGGNKVIRLLLLGLIRRFCKIRGNFLFFFELESVGSVLVSRKRSYTVISDEFLGTMKRNFRRFVC